MTQKYNDWKKVVGVVAVCKKDDKFLIIQRSKLESFTGLWEFPKGKHEIGETLEEGAKREFLEETGLNPKSVRYGGYHERIDQNQKRHVIGHDFLVEDFEREVKISEEHQDFKWVTLDEIKNMDLGKEISISTFKTLKNLNLFVE